MSFYNSFKQEDLADILAAYDNYIGEAAASRAFETGWPPVCVEEFYENEYQNIWKAGHDFSDFFFDATEMAAAEISAHGLALALDQFYYEFDTYNYKDEIDDRAEAVTNLETDILAGKAEDLKEHLKTEMLSYDETDSFSMAAKLIIAQIEKYLKQQEQSREQSTKDPLSDRSDVITLSCYADQVLPRTDNADLVETYQSAQFTVPRAWAEAQTKEMGFQDLDTFLDTYTWDHTDGWYVKAFLDGVLLGVSLSQGREVVKSLQSDKSTLSLEEKLFNANEVAQREQPVSPAKSNPLSL